MSEPPSISTPGLGAAAQATSGARELVSPKPAAPTGLAVGARVELIPTQLINASLLEARIQPLGAGTAWTANIRAQLTTELPASTIQALQSNPSQAPRLQAQVVSLSPALVLRVIPPSEQARPLLTGATPTDSKAWLTQQFRLHWPESRPLGETLDRLAGQLASSVAPANGLPGAHLGETNQVQRMLAALIGQLASSSDLTSPEGLEQAIGRSGIWLEALVARSASDAMSTTELSADLKAQLLTLAQRIRAQPNLPARPTSAADPMPAREAVQPTHPGDQRRAEATESPSARAAGQEGARVTGLAREVEGMIKQVVTHQLQTLDASRDQPQWVLELPFRTPAGLLALEADIRRERQGEAAEQEVWSMRLRLDLPRLGPLNILLSLRAGRLNASLQSGTPSGAEHIRRHLDELRAQLESRDIDVASLHAGYRAVAQVEPPIHSPLVSEQA